jgi:O-antigen ligase
VTASISWSIAPVLSFQEASRTAMYAGTFVLLLPAVAYWGSLLVDLTPLEVAALKEDQTQRLTLVSAATRITLWKIAWENFREHPLTGTGGNTYQLIFEQNRPANFPQSTKYAHSVWLSLLSDTGIFSFVAFAAFSVGCLCLAFYNAFSTTRTTRSRALLAGSAAALTAYLASSTIDWNWYISASTLPFFALAAVAAGTTPRRSERNEEQPAGR